MAVAASNIPDRPGPDWAIANAAPGFGALLRADVAFLSFIFFTATGALSRLGVDTPAWLAIYGVAGLFIIRDIDSVWIALKRVWPALLPCAIALLSTLWSVSSGKTAYSAFQFTVTCLIAVWVGQRFRIETIFLALAVGCGIGVALSLVNVVVGVIPGWMNGSAIGIYTQKNVFSGAALLLFFGGGVVLASARQGVAFLLLMLVCALSIVIGNSTSTFAYFAFTFSIYILAALGGGRPAHRVLNVGYVAMVSFAALAFVVFGFPQVIDAVLAAAEKDATLTGRTVLWQYAGQAISERPFLGVGFNAFWDPDINGIVKLIRETVDDRIRGFHNVYFEVRVANGILGFSAFILLLVMGFWSTLKLFIFEGGLAAAGALTFVTLAMINGATENVMFRQHEVYQILFVALLTAAVLRNAARVSQGAGDWTERAGTAGRGTPAVGTEDER